MRLIVASLGIALVGCSGHAPAPTPPRAETQPAAAEPAPPDTVAIYRAWVEASNGSRWPEVAAALGSDATLTPASSGMELAGAENILEFVKSFAVGFPDLTTRPLTIVTRPGHLVAVARATGTNSAAVGPFPATGREISFLGLTHFEFDASGAITRITAYADNLNFMGQMGQLAGDSRAAESDVTEPEAPVIAAQQGGDTEAANLELARTLVAAFNGHDAPALLGLYAPDALFDDQHLASPIITNRQIAGHYSALFPSFPDIAMADVQTFAAGDYVVIEYTLRGTHAAEYARLPGPASYRQIELQVAALLRVRGGAIAEHWVFVDGMAMGFQLGVIALPGGEPAETP